MGLLKEFKEFAVKGNVFDMAVGIIIGGAFGPIVTSLVNDIIMPPIGWVLGKVDFSKLMITLLEPDADGKGGVFIKYGAFINTLINFIIVAFAVFMLVKVVNQMKRASEPPPAPPAPPKPTKDQELLTEIRDVLMRR